MVRQIPQFLVQFFGADISLRRLPPHVSIAQPPRRCIHILTLHRAFTNNFSTSFRYLVSYLRVSEN